jgi:hypothetical protein
METEEKDYSRMTIIAGYCGLVPYIDRYGKIKDGVYTMVGYHAPVDLSACAEDEKSILKTALKQLSEQIDESYHNAIERDLLD